MKTLFLSTGPRAWRRLLLAAAGALAALALAGALAQGAISREDRVALGPGSPGEPGAPPPGAPKAGVVTAAQPGDHLIALTFDDGPDPRYTPQVLALLRRYGAHATFFVIGQEAERHPDLIRAIAASGNEVGIHGWSHRSFQRMDAATMERELERSARLLERVTGRPPRLFRPPFGRLNPTVLGVAGRLGLTVVLWTPGHDPFDWAGALPGLIVRRCCTGIRGGEIILLHDGGGDRRNTVRALGTILDRLRAGRYEPLTVSAMLERSARLQAGTPAPGGGTAVPAPPTGSGSR
ncbi:MAG: polysaccharide deacetylase family protein [Bacillota bacterium]|nr:polysaccharide deacetylase family protein [Bacillota bacterium]